MQKILYTTLCKKNKYSVDNLFCLGEEDFRETIDMDLLKYINL